MTHPPIAGIDGCRGGWVVALEDSSGAVSLSVIREAAELLARWPDLAPAVIDIPIGLTERTPRLADGSARRYLGPRGCTVFPAPYRAMLRVAGQPPESGHPGASRIRQSLDGKGCTLQCYMIFGKIADVDRMITPELQHRLIEGHPEVSFAAMRGDVPIIEKKSGHEGREIRKQALAPHFGDIDAFIAQGREIGAAPDDVLDALALLWTARRVRGGEPVLRFPRVAEQVTNGMIAQIVA